MPHLHHARVVDVVADLFGMIEVLAEDVVLRKVTRTPRSGDTMVVTRDVFVTPVYVVEAEDLLHMVALRQVYSFVSAESIDGGSPRWALVDVTSTMIQRCGSDELPASTPVRRGEPTCLRCLAE